MPSGFSEAAGVGVAVVSVGCGVGVAMGVDVVSVDCGVDVAVGVAVGSGVGVGSADGSGVGCGGDSDDSARAAAGWACGGSTPACCQSVNAAPGEQNSRARTLPPGTTRNARALPANAAVHSSAPSTRPALRMANTPLRNRYAPTAGQYAPSHACPPRKHCNISAKHEKNL